MKNYILFLLAFFIYKNSFAQPGGGGGIVIKNIIYKNEKIDIVKNKHFEYRFFSLNGKHAEETFRFTQTIASYFQHPEYPSEHVQINLDPHIYQSFTRDLKINNYRCYFKFKKTEMIIDFMNIISENGMGNSDIIDTLEIMQGHFTIDLDANNKNKYSSKKYNLENVTQKNLKNFIHKNGNSFHPIVDLKFLNTKENLFNNEMNLAMRSAYKGDNDLEKKHLQNATNLNDWNFSCSQYQQLLHAYKKLEEYHNTEKVLIQLEKCVNDDYQKEILKKEKIEVFIKRSELTKVENLYKDLLKTAENPFSIALEYAGFMENELKDRTRAIIYLTEKINEIPADEYPTASFGYFPYAFLYFHLGLMYERNNDINVCGDLLVKALETGYSNSSNEESKKILDTLILKHPTETNLYITRALINYKLGPYNGWGDVTKKLFQSGINDLEIAKKLDPKNYKVYLYKAMLHNMMKDTTNAEMELNECMKLNSDDPFIFLTLFELNRMNGKAKGNANDKELIMYREKLAKWKFSLWEK